MQQYLWILPEEASIHKAEMTAMREREKKEDMSCSPSGKTQNHPILNQIYDILVELVISPVAKLMQYLKEKTSFEDI